MGDGLVQGKILVMKVYIDSSDYIYNYTGKLSKTIILTEDPFLEPLFRPVKGFFKQIRVSPPIQDGLAKIPYYEVERDSNGKVNYILKPVMLQGDYIIEVGGSQDIISDLEKTFKKSIGVRTRVKFENLVVSYIINNVFVVEPSIDLSSLVVLRTVSPALLSNPFVPNQHVRRFTVSPGVLLWIPYMISKDMLSNDVHEVQRAVFKLESCLWEHYSVRQKTVMVNYDNAREPALLVKGKYVISNKDEECKEIVREALIAARVYGIGSSRANGFGSIRVSGH